MYEIKLNRTNHSINVNRIASTIKVDHPRRTMELQHSGKRGIQGLPGTNSALSKSLSVENPSNSENISMYFTPVEVTISEMKAVLIGFDTPSLTWTIRFDQDNRSDPGTEVVVGGTQTTSTTSGSDITSFDNPVIPAGSFVWLKTTQASGTLTEFSVTIVYTEN